MKSCERMHPGILNAQIQVVHRDERRSISMLLACFWRRESRAYSRRDR